jgi:hypothetical protein
VDEHDRHGYSRKNSSQCMPPAGLSPEEELQWWKNRIAEAENAGGLHSSSSAAPSAAAGWGEAEAKRSSVSDHFVASTSSFSSHRRGSSSKAGGYLSDAESQRIEDRMAALNSATNPGSGSGRPPDGYRPSQEAASRAEAKGLGSHHAGRDGAKGSK